MDSKKQGKDVEQDFPYIMERYASEASYAVAISHAWFVSLLGVCLCSLRIKDRII